MIVCVLAKTIHKNSRNGKYVKKQRISKVEVLLLLGIYIPELRKEMPGSKSPSRRFKPPTATEAAHSQGNPWATQWTFKNIYKIIVLKKVYLQLSYRYKMNMPKILYNLLITKRTSKILQTFQRRIQRA